MSNEEIVLKIQSGAVEYKSELWQQIKGVVYIICQRWVPYLRKLRGYELDEIINIAWFGVERAIKAYNSQKSIRFTTYLKNHIYNVLKESAGIRGKKELLNDCLSLDESINSTSDTDGINVIDTIEDENAAEAFDEINNQSEYDWLWSIIKGLDDRSSRTIIKHYKYGKSFREIGEDENVSIECIRQREQNAFRQLRRNTALREYFAETYGYRHIGVKAFNNTWTSSTELAALKIFCNVDRC